METAGGGRQAARVAILDGKGRLSRVSAKGGKRTRIGPILRFHLLLPGVFSLLILIYTVGLLKSKTGRIMVILQNTVSITPHDSIIMFFNSVSLTAFKA